MGDMTVTRRNALAGLGVAAVVLPAEAAVGKASAATVLIEQTYLKANAGLRADLANYIEKNWFAMDQIGLDQGIFTSFWLMDAIDSDDQWDFVMAVGYPQLGGYEAPATKAAFDAIRKAHRDVPVNGRSLKDLGKIVQHYRLRVGGGNRLIGKAR